MKIRELHVQGYRSLKNVVWRPESLTVLIGPNASGKSNLLKVIDLLSMSAAHALGDHIQREGGYDSLAWDGQAESVRLKVVLDPSGHERELQSKEAQLGIGRMSESEKPDERLLRSLNYDIELGRMPAHRSFYVISREEYRGESTNGDSTPLIRRGTFEAFRADPDLSESQLPFGTESFVPGETILSASGPGSGPHPLLAVLHRFLVHCHIFHGISTAQDSPLRAPPVVRHEKHVDPLEDNLINVLHTRYTENRSFRENIDAAMTAAFGNEFEELVFSPAADQRIQFRIRWRHLKQARSAADLSDGTLRFLHLLAVLADDEPPPFIAIDEPETGLHPSMLRIIAEFAVEASERTQVVFITHSPQFLDAFPAGFVPAVTVAELENGETRLSNKSGDDLRAWLKDYSLGQLHQDGTLEALS